MPIDEQQLQTWTALGSVPQSSATYESIKNVLEQSDAPYAGRGGYEIFLQGSYRNHTNVHGDSDVDIVICQTNLFYYSLDALPEVDKAAFQRAHNSVAEYQLPAFKADVSAWLARNYPQDFDPTGDKALYIRGRGNRRNADVLVAAPHKRFTSFPNPENQRLALGIMFMPGTGERTVNYPKQHIANMTQQHQNTADLLKPTVRVFKRMRNKLITDGLLAEGIAPSYFIEGLLYNAPPNLFVSDMQTTVAGVLSWAVAIERAQLVCPNRQYWLVRDNEKTSWPTANCEVFLNAAIHLWRNWGRSRIG